MIKLKISKRKGLNPGKIRLFTVISRDENETAETINAKAEKIKANLSALRRMGFKVCAGIPATKKNLFYVFVVECSPKSESLIRFVIERIVGQQYPEIKKKEEKEKEGRSSPSSFYFS